MKHFTDEKLIIELKNSVFEERKITALILEYLREVELRKLHLPMGYSSLFEFCVKELGYAESSAQRRISAMRLSKEIPEVKSKIISGELSLTVVSQVQSFFRNQAKKNEAYNKAEKIELLSRLENSSTRECEKVLLKLDPEMSRKDIVRPISENLTELRLTVDASFIADIEKLKNILSNSQPDTSTKDVLALALKHLLEKKDLSRVMKAKSQAVPSVMAKSEPKQFVLEQSLPRLGHDSLPARAVKTRYIPKLVKQSVWRKSEGQCHYIDPKTGRRCSSQKFLHIDHIRAYSRGGLSTHENLQLLCASHNIWKADQ